MKQAKWVKEERQKILVQAQNEADDIIKEAENVIENYLKTRENKENNLLKEKYERLKITSIAMGIVGLIGILISVIFKI